MITMAEVLKNPSAYASYNVFNMEHPLYECYFACRQAGLAAAECADKDWGKAYNEAFTEEYSK